MHGLMRQSDIAKVLRKFRTTKCMTCDSEMQELAKCYEAQDGFRSVKVDEIPPDSLCEKDIGGVDQNG